MSEYQYYEFQAIDRLLTKKEKSYVKTLSSRVKATSTQAVFTYSYGDFSGDPLTLLETCFDVMLYVANWGARQLAFRFPRALVDLKKLKQYYYAADEITLKTTEQYAVLSIAFHEEDGGGGEWLEGEGLLATLAPLRGDIMRGDLRALYLAYLQADQAVQEMEDVKLNDGLEYLDEEVPEDAGTPVELTPPPGLGQLSSPLQAFVEFFEIEAKLVRRAAAQSAALPPQDDRLERWVAALPQAERTAWLVRLARGEPHLDMLLLHRLHEVGGQ